MGGGRFNQLNLKAPKILGFIVHQTGIPIIIQSLVKCSCVVT